MNQTLQTELALRTYEELERIQGEAQSIHDEFLQIMPDYFGLKEAPPRLLVRLSGGPRNGHGWFSYHKKNFEIIIGIHNEESFSLEKQIAYARVVSAHESSHYLHYLFLDNQFGEGSVYNRSIKMRDSVLLKELVAEWGSHLFFRKKKEKIPEFSRNTLCELLYPYLERNGHPEVIEDIEGSLLEYISTRQNLSGVLSHLERCGFKEMLPKLSRWGFYIT